MQAIRIGLLVLIIIGLGLMATQTFWVQPLVNWILQNENAPQTIGGQRDAHGCLTGAGYGFDANVGACTRSWELTPDIASAAKTAVEKVGTEYGLTVASFNSYEDGTYDITLQKEDGSQVKVNISNGAASSPAPVESAPASESTQSSQSVSASGTTSAGSYGKAKVYTDAELLAMAGTDFSNGSVPLGDDKYVTSAPKQGYVYLCNVRKDNPGSQVVGPWISGSTWNFLKKVTVDGAVSWPSATFTNIISGAYRMLSGNDLPIGHTTGIFPVAASDDAHQYDPNPNTISAQSIKVQVPADPVYSEVPNCMGMEVGIMTNGVALFNGFDAGLRDAPAHELQDSNDGHPQGSGEYHYHSIPAWAHNASVHAVIGYAYDGFPITGPVVANGKYLTTADLDVCHGIVSDVTIDGKSVTTYHYVMTYDFPYSASCFRGKASTYMSEQPGSTGGGSRQQSAPQQTQGGAPTPPQEAINACAGKSANASCSFSTPNGTISGTCKTPPGTSSLACVPQ